MCQFDEFVKFVPPPLKYATTENITPHNKLLETFSYNKSPDPVLMFYVTPYLKEAGKRIPKMTGATLRIVGHIHISFLLRRASKN